MKQARCCHLPAPTPQIAAVGVAERRRGFHEARAWAASWARAFCVRGPSPRPQEGWDGLPRGRVHLQPRGRPRFSARAAGRPRLRAQNLVQMHRTRRGLRAPERSLGFGRGTRSALCPSPQNGAHCSPCPGSLRPFSSLRLGGLSLAAAIRLRPRHRGCGRTFRSFTWCQSETRLWEQAKDEGPCPL